MYISPVFSYWVTSSMMISYLILYSKKISGENTFVFFGDLLMTTKLNFHVLGFAGSFNYQNSMKIFPEIYLQVNLRNPRNF